MKQHQNHDNRAVPNGWHKIRLDEIAEVIGGSTPSRSREEFWGGHIPWVVPSELTDLTERYLRSTNESVTDAGMKSAGLKMIPAGSVLLTSRATVGVTAINACPVATNQGFQSLVAKDGTDGLWLYYCISSMRSDLERKAAGSTFLEVSRDSVRSLPVLIPPYCEQRAIAEALGSIDESIERTEATIVASENLRDALIHELLTRGGVPGWHTEWKDAPDSGAIPANWKMVRLGDVCEPPEYGATASAQPHDPDLPRYVRITDLTDDGRLNDDDPRSADPARVDGYELEHGDLLFARTGATVGKTFLYRETDGPCVYAGYLIRFRPVTQYVLPEYLELATHSQPYYRWVASMFRAGAQPNINANEYASLPLCLPPIGEQRAITALLDGIQTMLNEARTEATSLRRLKESTAESLLSGRVRVDGASRSTSGRMALTKAKKPFVSSRSMR